MMHFSETTGGPVAQVALSILLDDLFGCRFPGDQLLRCLLFERVAWHIIRVLYHIGEPEHPHLMPAAFFIAANIALAEAVAGKPEGVFT